MFIGRQAELKFLEDRYQSKRGEMIVLYGRRRIGKTETLREFCKDKPHIYFACTQSIDQVQLRNFSARMFTQDLPQKAYISEFASWDQAFQAICDLPFGPAKKLVVIDEFPYLCQGNPSIPSILQNLWDQKLHAENVMIILCGSAMSFMEKELLAEKNPLYGRATGIYKMEEMSFYDAIQFFPKYSPRDLVVAYAILGGIPHYLRQWDPDLSIRANVQGRILTKGCVLYSEVEFLLHQELRESPIYNAILEAVALGNTRLSDISQKSLVENTSKTSVYLKNLTDLGIVEREFSVDAKWKTQANRRRGLYRLRDHFFQFWYAFGFPNFSQLEDGDVEGVYQYVIEPNLDAFASWAFEDICRDFVRGLQKQNALPFRYHQMGRWMGKTTVRDSSAPSGLRTVETEIDLLAVNREGTAYLLGECKWKKRPFSYGEYLDTLAKLSSLTKTASFHYALFSGHGFDPKLSAEAAANPTRLKLYDLETIVSGKGEDWKES